MKISKAFREVLSRTQRPSIEGKTSVLEGISILKSKGLSALPVVSTRRTVPETAKRSSSSYALTGYSFLSKLAETEPRGYPKFLDEPCEQSTLSLGSVSPDDDILSLLQVFESSTFGFAAIDVGGGTSIIRLMDVVALYGKGVLSCDLSAGNVASGPIFSMSGSSTLREYLLEVIRRKFRRVMIANTKSFVSDGQVIDYILEKARSGEIRNEPRRVSEARLEDLGPATVPSLSDSTKVQQLAAMFIDQKEDCILTERGVVTPWDLVIKPWRAGRLKILD